MKTQNYFTNKYMTKTYTGTRMFGFVWENFGIRILSN